MKASKKYKISIALSVVVLILFGISMVSGLMPVKERIYSIDKISLYLGFALLGFSYMFLNKSKSNDELEEN